MKKNIYLVQHVTNVDWDSAIEFNVTVEQLHGFCKVSTVLATTTREDAQKLCEKWNAEHKEYHYYVNEISLY